MRKSLIIFNKLFSLKEWKEQRELFYSAKPDYALSEVNLT
jgi:hypothetical protein